MSNKTHPVTANGIHFDLYQWKNRVLVMFAPSRDDERARRQVNFIQGHKNQFRDYELALFELYNEGGSAFGGMSRDDMDDAPITPEAVKNARSHFNLTQDDFCVILLGKDGGVKFQSDTPTDIRELFALIDSMPMRKAERRDADWTTDRYNG